MNSKLYFAWNGSVPPINVICQPMPNTPHLPLTGGGISKRPLSDFLGKLEKDFRNQSGRYYAYVLDNHNSDDESDIFSLETWQVCRPDDGTYDAIVILYYSALNPYLAIKKYMGQDLADEYLARDAAMSAIAEALT